MPRPLQSPPVSYEQHPRLKTKLEQSTKAERIQLANTSDWNKWNKWLTCTSQQRHGDDLRIVRVLEEFAKRMMHLSVQEWRWLMTEVTCTLGASKVATCTSSASTWSLASRAQLIQERDLLKHYRRRATQFNNCSVQKKRKATTEILTCNLYASNLSVGLLASRLQVNI
eukprot:Gb_36234 [translate_table: standard]